MNERDADDEGELALDIMVKGLPDYTVQRRYTEIT